MYCRRAFYSHSPNSVLLRSYAASLHTYRAYINKSIDFYEKPSLAIFTWSIVMIVVVAFMVGLAIGYIAARMFDKKKVE